MGTFFGAEVMRIDYYHIADKTTEIITIDAIYKQGLWAGNPRSLIDPFDNGMYYIKIYDTATGVLIYSNGFNSYCGEYQTTTMAAKGIVRTFHESALLPFPKKTITFTIEKRDRGNQLIPLFSRVIDPRSEAIIREALIPGVTVLNMVTNGGCRQKVDLAVIAEGYTAAQLGKFKRDLANIIRLLFANHVFQHYKNEFNIYGLFKPSMESGTDLPQKGVFKNTLLRSTFNSLGLDRYLLTEGNRTIRDIAAHVPYDALIILVNCDEYGGGGLYRFYTIFCSDTPWSELLLSHEFGHSFGGLADEYYVADVPYNDFYPTGVEPVEPNITALLEPGKLKWRHLVSAGTPLPTPWEKETYDRLPVAKQLGYLVQLKKTAPYRDRVGAFEGAGYTSKGLYRPELMCVMYTQATHRYCAVCAESIARMIDYYTGGSKKKE